DLAISQPAIRSWLPSASRWLLAPPPVLALSTHMAALDGLRGVAILAVMLFHQSLVVGDSALDRAVAFWTYSGWDGVDLFFVLSGFLITGILFDSRSSPGSRYFRTFYSRRVLRILPLYYGVALFTLVILAHIPNYKSANLARISGAEVWYWVYLQNWSIGAAGLFRNGILDVTWSLAIEEQFYLVWPIAVLLLSRRALMKLCVG